MLPWFTKYPNQNDEILNLDWVITQVENLKAAYEAFLAANSLTFADPITWDITKQYSKNTIVLSPEGDAYLSKKAVGKGIQLNNTDYWLEIFNFAEYVRTANSNLTMHNEQNTTRATAAYAVDDWLLWEDVLYKVTTAINADDLLVVGTNIVQFTVEDFCRAWVTYGTYLINQYKIDIDASELAYKNEIDASELAYKNQLDASIAQTTESLQAQLNAAIAGVTVDSEVINARVGVDGTIFSTLGDAIRTQIAFLNMQQKGNTELLLNGISSDIFEKGAIDQKGEDSTYLQIRRARFKTFYTLPFTLIITGADASVRGYYVEMDSSGNVSESSYFIKKTIPAGTKFRLMLTDQWDEAEPVEHSVNEILAQFTFDILQQNLNEMRQSIINNIIVSDNIFDGTYISNKAINSSDGTIQTIIDRYATNFIPINGDQTYHVYRYLNNKFAFYDADQQFIDVSNDTDVVENGNLKSEFIAPTNARYIRLTAFNTERFYMFLSSKAIYDEFSTTKAFYDNKQFFVNNKLNYVDCEFNADDFMQGSANADGNITEFMLNSTIFHKNVQIAPYNLVIKSNNNARIQLLYFDDNDNYVSRTQYIYSAIIYKGQHYKLGIRKTSDDTIANILKCVKIYAPSEHYPFSVIPSYYYENNYIQGKVDNVISNSPENGLMFAFITDFHVSDNECHSPALIKYIKENTNSVPFTIFGGDVLISTVPKGQVVMDDAKVWQQILSVMDKPNVYQVQGNHDYLGFYYDENNERTAYTAPYRVCRQLIMGNLENKNIVACPDKIAYYFDIAESNTRIIVLNDFDYAGYHNNDFGGGLAMSFEQVQWVANVALADDNKNVIFVSHCTYDTNMNGEHQERFSHMQDLFKAIVNKTTYSYGALNKDYTNTNLTFVAHFVGHMHEDSYNIDDGVLTICTTCDYLTNDRTAGTVNEQAFDIVAVDYDAKTIKTTRIGYGSDRQFNF